MAENDKLYTEADLAKAREGLKTQEQVDAIIKERLSREKGKYGDYDELKKFKDEHEKGQEELKKKTLEEQGKYEELKKEWGLKESNYQKALTDKDQSINNLKINHALGIEINKNNAYDDAVSIIREQITIGEDGTPKMKGKDSVGNEIAISLEDGVKEFLKERPYLVKTTVKGGGGTPPAGGGGGVEGSEGLDDLNRQLMEAQSAGNAAKVKELKAKIGANFASRNVRRYV